MPDKLKAALPQNKAQWSGAAIFTLILQITLEVLKHVT